MHQKLKFKMQKTNKLLFKLKYRVLIIFNYNFIVIFLFVNTFLTFVEKNMLWKSLQKWHHLHRNKHRK